MASSCIIQGLVVLPYGFFPLAVIAFDVNVLPKFVDHPKAVAEPMWRWAVLGGIARGRRGLTESSLDLLGVGVVGVGSVAEAGAWGFALALARVAAVAPSA